MIDNIDTQNVTQENIKYLEHICNNDFYKNDREFIAIIKKLTKQSSSISNKALSLINILDEAERIKFNIIQKELSLGLKEQDKPYGENSLSKIYNISLVYRPVSQKKQYITTFLELLDQYFTIEDTKEKKIIIETAKKHMDMLIGLGEKPKQFIINRNREKVWHMLSSGFDKTMKQFEVDLFIEKIHLTRIQYQIDIDEISDYYKNRIKIFTEIKELKNTSPSDEKLEKLQKCHQKLETKLSTNIEPLLIDTQKIMNSLDFMLEELPDVLTPTQQNELKLFLPAISEYYIDQCYSVSGGNSYTKLEKNLKKLQEDINNDKSIDDILKNLDTLEYTMQHLYILHWISESILKDILHCYEYSCSMGRTITQYDKKYNNTKTILKIIREAVYVRNAIAHQGLIWEPEKIKFAIDTYRDYIEKISIEQKIDLTKTRLPKEDRELTIAQQDLRHSSYIDKHFNININELKEMNKELLNELKIELTKKYWKLDDKTKSHYKSKIKQYKHDVECKLQDEFSLKIFNMSYKEVYNKLVEYARKNNKNFDKNEKESKREATKSLYWLFKNQNDSGAERNIKMIKKRIGDGLWNKIFS